MQEKQSFDFYEWCLGILEKTFLRGLTPLLCKYREVILYLFFGACTTLVSLLSFWLFESVLHVNALISNIISWVVSVTFAFVVNRLYVFDAAGQGVLRQAVSFYGGRLATLGVEELIIYVFITRLGFPAMLIKLIAQVIIIILNYVISKLIVFTKHGE